MIIAKQFVLTSSARNTSILFASVAEAEDFLVFAKPTEETICLVDLFDDSIVFTHTYN